MTHRRVDFECQGEYFFLDYYHPENEGVEKLYTALDELVYGEPAPEVQHGFHVEHAPEVYEFASKEVASTNNRSRFLIKTSKELNELIEDLKEAIDILDLKDYE